MFFGGPSFAPRAAGVKAARAVCYNVAEGEE